MPETPPVEGATKNIGTGLGRKIGPLPLWGWILGVGGLGIIGYLIYQSIQQGQQASAGAIGSLLPGAAGGGNGGGGGLSLPTIPPATTTTSPVSAASWVATTASQVSQATGIPLNQVTDYLNDLLAGTPPVGSGIASTAYEKVVASALSLGGQPPTTIPIVPQGTNPFGTQAAWLTAILQSLPAGTPQSVQNEIVNLVNGTTATISQAAADALGGAQNIVGIGPVPISFSLTPVTVPTPPPVIVPPNLTAPTAAQLIPWWHGAQWWTTANPALSFVQDLTGSFGNISNAQAWQIWNFTQANQPYFAPGGAEYQNLSQVISQVLAGQTPTTAGLSGGPAPAAALSRGPVRA